MAQRRIWLALALLIAVAGPAFAASPLMTLLDPDNDGAVDVDEIRAAAATAFDRMMSGYGEAALLSQGAKDRLKSKYIALVIRWFRIADIKGDGRLDEDELRSPAGRKLERLLIVGHPTDPGQ
jgi:hypothetical protein